jgi:hypothetical protein
LIFTVPLGRLVQPAHNFVHLLQRPLWRKRRDQLRISIQLRIQNVGVRELLHDLGLSGVVRAQAAGGMMFSSRRSFCCVSRSINWVAACSLPVMVWNTLAKWLNSSSVVNCTVVVVSPACRRRTPGNQFGESDSGRLAPDTLPGIPGPQ